MKIYGILEGTKYDCYSVNSIMYKNIEQAMEYVENRLNYLKQEFGDVYEKKGDVPYWICDDYDFIQIEIFTLKD